MASIVIDVTRRPAPLSGRFGPCPTGATTCGLLVGRFIRPSVAWRNSWWLLRHPHAVSKILALAAHRITLRNLASASRPMGDGLYRKWRSRRISTFSTESADTANEGERVGWGGANLRWAERKLETFLTLGVVLRDVWRPGRHQLGRSWRGMGDRPDGVGMEWGGKTKGPRNARKGLPQSRPHPGRHGPARMMIGRDAARMMIGRDAARMMIETPARWPPTERLGRIGGILPAHGLLPAILPGHSPCDAPLCCCPSVCCCWEVRRCEPRLTTGRNGAAPR